MNSFGVPLLTDQPKTRFMLITSVLLLIDAVFFSTTNPLRLSGLILIVAFVLVGINIYAFLRLGLYVLGVYGLIKSGTGRRLVLLMSINLTIALALQSLGELTARDGLVLLLLSAVAYAYLSYGRKSNWAGCMNHT